MGNVNASQNRGVNGVKGSGMHATHKGQQKGEKVRPERCGDAAVEGGREEGRGKERGAVICHGKRPFSQYYFPQSVINCAHISPFSTVSLLLLFPFRFCRCSFFVFNR